MKFEQLHKQLAKAQETVRVLQEELAETNRGLMALTMELEQRVEERTAELSAVHAELKQTNSELMQLTLEQEDLVAQRTVELEAANEVLRQSRLAALNMMEDAIVARTEAEQANAGLQREMEQRKRAEEEVRLLNAQLDQRVRERTAQLEAANRELEAFSYSVSHDLRAPLRHVMGFSDLLQRDAGSSLSEKGLRHLTTISEAAQRMGQLIDDLLTFSRVGRSEMQKTQVNLDQLVRETLGDFQADTKDRHIVWQTHPLPAVWADRALLRTVLVNLIANAVKFTSHRAEAKIEIGCVPGGDGSPGGIVLPAARGEAVPTIPQRDTVIFIRDDGAGFDPRYADKLFGVFQRLHSHDEFEGTGIGLANVQRIIHRHGGRTWAEGAVEGGATFYFSIPQPSIRI